MATNLVQTRETGPYESSTPTFVFGEGALVLLDNKNDETELTQVRALELRHQEAQEGRSINEV